MSTRLDLERSVTILDRLTGDLDRLAHAVAYAQTGETVTSAIGSRIERCQSDLAACRELINIAMD